MTAAEMSGIDDWLAVLGVLWPSADITRSRGPGKTSGHAFVVLPSARRPRVLAPLSPRGLATEAVWRPSAADRSMRSAGRRAFAIAAGSRLSTVLFRDRITIRHESAADGSIVQHLAEVVGEPVAVSISLGSIRANRKPVLEVHAIDGRLIGYAKVGVSELTAELVRAEADALGDLAGHTFREFSHPSRLWHGRWRSLEVLLLSALPRRAGGSSGPPIAAMRELASSAGTTRAPLGKSPWLRHLAERFASVSQDEWRRRLMRLYQTFRSRHGSTTLTFGAWHGDWGPWNMSWLDGRPQVWDWERYGRDVPVGLDAVHFSAFPALLRVGEAGLARRTLDGPATHAVRQVLASSALPEIEAIIDSYLLEIATRFATDAGPLRTGATALTASWYLDVAAARLESGADGPIRRGREVP